MTSVFRAVRLSTLLVAILLIASPLSAQVRQRPVKLGERTLITVTGRVLDASNGAGVKDALVHVDGQLAATTAEDGSFAIEGLQPGSHTISAERWAYQPLVISANLTAGTPLELRLQPGKVASVRKKDGSTVPLDFDLLEFGYFVAFVGWRNDPWLDLCQTDGSNVVIPTSEMKTVVVVGKRTDNTNCCRLAPGLLIRITKTDNSTVEGTIKSSCEDFRNFATSRNRTTGATESIELEQVAQIDIN